MRVASVLLFFGVACGAGAAACASITGLDAYSTCSTGCPDATTTHPHPEEGGPAPDASGDDTGATDDAVDGDDSDATGADQTSPDDTGADAGPGEAAPSDANDAGRPGDATLSIPCPDGGCPASAATSYSSCPFGSCNGSTTGACTTGGGCFCVTDSECKSAKCVKVTGENDRSCGSNCTGTGSRDGFDCELASPGIPTPAGATSYSCPPGSGYQGTTLSCDPTHTNCYCTSDNQCPSGKCVPSANNNNCSSCTGTGAPDYRGCQSLAAIPNCPIYILCPSNTTCAYPFCVCNSGSVCESGNCIGGTGSNTDGHGCQPPPSSIPCQSAGGSSCITALTPAPVLNSAHSACVCVADSDCSSGKCVNKNSQCTGTCTGSGAADSQNCQTASSTAQTWACPVGNCKTATSPGATCSAGGVPCWCTADTQCPGETRCSSWAGCGDAGACTGSGTGNAFNCVP
ncbi:MAG: hypothetical protein ACRENE_01560 [Polyangiaceae bacterium]